MSTGISCRNSLQSSSGCTACVPAVRGKHRRCRRGFTSPSPSVVAAAATGFSIKIGTRVCNAIIEECNWTACRFLSHKNTYIALAARSDCGTTAGTSPGNQSENEHFAHLITRGAPVKLLILRDRRERTSWTTSGEKAARSRRMRRSERANRETRVCAGDCKRMAEHPFTCFLLRVDDVRAGTTCSHPSLPSSYTARYTSTLDCVKGNSWSPTVLGTRTTDPHISWINITACRCDSHLLPISHQLGRDLHGVPSFRRRFAWNQSTSSPSPCPCNLLSILMHAGDSS